jgi:hypothetical protein
MSFAKGFVGGFSWIRILPLRPLRPHDTTRQADRETAEMVVPDEIVMSREDPGRNSTSESDDNLVDDNMVRSRRVIIEINESIARGLGQVENELAQVMRLLEQRVDVEEVMEAIRESRATVANLRSSSAQIRRTL